MTRFTLDSQSEDKILPFNSFRCGKCYLFYVFYYGILFSDGLALMNLLDSKLATIGAIKEAIRLSSELLVDLSPDEDDFLMDIASVESKFGRDDNTFRPKTQFLPPYCSEDGKVLKKYKKTGGLGIWQVDLSFYCDFKNRFHQKVFRKRTDVIKKKMGLDLTKTMPEDLFNPLVNVLFARLKLGLSASSTKKMLKKRCGKKTIVEYNSDCSPEIDIEVCELGLRWYYCYNGRGATKTSDDELPDLPKEGTKKFSDQLRRKEPKSDEGCVHGQRDPATDCRTCICEKGFTGEACNMLDCGCANYCGDFGLCNRQKDGSNKCECFFRWQGQCCEEFLPAFVFGDPHLRTLDGRFSLFAIHKYFRYYLLQD